MLRKLTDSWVKQATIGSRAGQQREHEMRAMAEKVNAMARVAICGVAALSALPEFGISALPAALVIAAAILGLSVAGQATVRDAMAGFRIILEDQFSPGETIQTGETSGRVESVTWRRTVVRDSRGALVTIANGDLRKVSNLSRDWSQGYVDVDVPAGMALERPVRALEAAAAELRGDTAWSQALVDGPRVLGVQDYSLSGTRLRLQVRTPPMRQEEVCRELRRRIQLEFQRQGIAGESGPTRESPTMNLT